MNNIELTDQEMIVRITGIDRFLSFKSQFASPLEHIVEASIGVDPAVQAEFNKSWRWPGAYMPGIAIAGTFIHKDYRQFWNVHTNKKAITIKLTGERYAALVLEVANPQDMVETINQALSKFRELQP